VYMLRIYQYFYFVIREKGPEACGLMHCLDLTESGRIGQLSQSCLRIHILLSVNPDHNGVITLVYVNLISQNKETIDLNTQSRGEKKKEKQKKECVIIFGWLWRGFVID
jgi:hypothetical protein